MKQVLKAALLASVLLTGACAQEGGGPLGIVAFDPNHHVSAAEPLFGKDEDRCVDSPAFLMSIYKGAKTDLSFLPAARRQTCGAVLGAIKAALAFGSFLDGNDKPVHEPYTQRQRNEAIDALIAASNRKCGRYTAFLQQFDANVNSSFGILAQAAAILATVSSGGTAQGFAAAAGISSGARGTLNQAHFSNQTIGVLARAFEISREEQRRNIVNMQQCPPAQYTLMRGLEDAFRYHSSCSIVVGLKETQRAVEQSSAPNLEAFNTMLDQLAEAQTKMRALSPPKEETTDNTQTGTGTGTTGGGNGTTGGSGTTGGGNGAVGGAADADGNGGGNGDGGKPGAAKPADGGSAGDRAAPACPLAPQASKPSKT